MEAPGAENASDSQLVLPRNARFAREANTAVFTLVKFSSTGPTDNFCTGADWMRIIGPS